MYIYIYIHTYIYLYIGKLVQWQEMWVGQNQIRIQDKTRFHLAARLHLSQTPCLCCARSLCLYREVNQFWPKKNETFLLKTGDCFFFYESLLQIKLEGS